MSDLYVLAEDGRTPVLMTEDPAAWACWHRENPDSSLVGYDEVGIAVVETKFWGSELNHLARQINPRAPSYVFQTSAYHRHSGRLIEQTRSSTWDEAERQHLALVARVKAL